MRESTITSLKDLLKVYDGKKSDIEISHMLSIPIERVRSERKKAFLENMKSETNRH